MLQIWPGDEIEKGINFSNSKQREIFNVVHTWDKDYIEHDGHDAEPVYIFLFGQWRDR